MNCKPAILIALLLPMLTIPLDVSGTWWGIPAWACCSLLVTMVVAAVIAGWFCRWWEQLANRAEMGDPDDSVER